MALTLKIETQEDWDNYKKKRKEDLETLFSFVEDTDLVDIVLNNDICNIKFCTARRVGKTYMILGRMLYDLIHLPWFNGACIRKFQHQVKNNLMKPMLSLGDDMVKCGIIKLAVRTQIVADLHNIYYDKRKIVFLSIENPNNSLGIQAINNSKHEVSPLFQYIFVDEIIQANDKYKISVDESIESLDTIRGSLLRGIKTPFGSEMQEVWAFNPWDAQNQIYQKDIERILPVGQHYITKKMEDIVSKNHEKLLKEKGEVWTYNKEEDTLIYRASHKLIPEVRYSKKLKIREKKMKEENFDKWLCEFGGIHGNFSNDRSTYLGNMGKRPEFYDKVKHGAIESVYVGLDRGLRDDTAFSLVGIANNNKDKSIVILDTKTFYADKEETKLRYIFDNLDFLKKWFLKINPISPITILADGAAKEFNNIFYDRLCEDKELAMYFNMTNALKTTSKKDGKNDWDIANRQDFFNKIFAQKKIFFSKDMETWKIEELWIHFANCVNEDNGKRNEKPKVNKLDIINSVEYAISYEDKDSFNLSYFFTLKENKINI